ncbi:MAG: hypothetical protein ACI843_001627 [Psychrobacter glaciei]|jgi:hypothetical protein
MYFRPDRNDFEPKGIINHDCVNAAKGSKRC